MILDATEHTLLAEAFQGAIASASGSELDAALAELGWADLLADLPEVAVSLVFRALGESGSHASVVNDVVGGPLPLPFADGGYLRWDPAGPAGTLLDPDLPLRPADGPGVSGDALDAGRRALGWWLVGTGHAMLALARRHALERIQFGKPIAAFQAVRHRLAETLVALEGAEATLVAAEDEWTSLLAKAAAGQAALTAARHCQQVLGGIGFTAEHDLHRHVRRALVLDTLLGSAHQLTREAGQRLIRTGHAPRLVQL